MWKWLTLMWLALLAEAGLLLLLLAEDGLLLVKLFVTVWEWLSGVAGSAGGGGGGGMYSATGASS